MANDVGSKNSGHNDRSLSHATSQRKPVAIFRYSTGWVKSITDLTCLLNIYVIRFSLSQVM